MVCLVESKLLRGFFKPWAFLVWGLLGIFFKLLNKGFLFLMQILVWKRVGDPGCFVELRHADLAMGGQNLRNKKLFLGVACSKGSD